MPGGHFIHPSCPLEEELTKVPKGHGKNTQTLNSPPSSIRLNPDANRAETWALPTADMGFCTVTASVSESRGFLREIYLLFDI